FDLPGAMPSPGTAGFDGLDALAIDRRRRGRGLPADPLAVFHDQMVVDGLEQAVATKVQEPAIDAASWRKILGQHAPGATGPQHIEDGVHDLAHRPEPRPARLGRLWHERREDLPFCV